MFLVADLHLHSHYSRATSSDLTFEHLARWAQLKGVHIVGTGDIAHPGWLAEMQAKLEPAEEGLFRLKPDVAQAVQQAVPPACRGTVRFLLAGEISNIYKRGDRVRKVHNVIFAPSLEAVARIQMALERIGNIRADGRPILGLDSRDLLETILEVDPRCHLIPAHIWTPWFSMLGSMSGFDSVEECFDDLTPHIFALETGLSSDPPMNWRVSNLDRYTLVSNSDAHSPQKLAREATLFDIEPGYDALFAALRSGDPASFLGTVEFFPEEGKYHADGHRKCGVRWDPVTTLAHNGLCSVCGKPVTVGVMHRVEILSDRPAGGRPERVAPFYSLVPLPEILSELYGVGAGSKRVQESYHSLLGRLGPELFILRQAPLEAIAATGGERLAAGIGRMRRGDVTPEGGYDGEYGVIRLFDQETSADPSAQPSLFTETDKRGKQGSGRRKSDGKASLSAPAPTAPTALADASPALFTSAPPSLFASLNPEQREAALCIDAPLIIVAGPGTGKTRTVTVRMAHLLQDRGVAPEAILAITFTNKAAAEMAARLHRLVGGETADRVTIRTFHAFGAGLLRQQAAHLGLSPDFAIYTEEDRLALLKTSYPNRSQQALGRYLDAISAAKNRLVAPSALPSADGGIPDADVDRVHQAYEAALRRSQALDFDDLIVQAIRLLESHPDILAALQARYRWITVDEYQDLNTAQHRLLRLLTAGGANLCVIGDPDQAIYGFRGADHRYFLSFDQEFPQAARRQLGQNYRSSQLILDAATQVIARNPDRQALRIFSDFVDQVKLDIYQAPTDKAEAEYVVHQIEQMVGGTSYFSLDSGRVEGHRPGERGFADFAVLYRLSSQSRLLVEAFERSGIPFQTAGLTPFYAHKDIRGVMAFLWLLQAPASRPHLAAALEAGQLSLAPEALDQVWAWVSEQGGSLVAAFQRAMGLDRLTLAQRRGLAAYVAFWREFEQGRGGAPVVDSVRSVVRFLREQCGRVFDAAETEHLRQLAQRATPFGDHLDAFLDAAVLHSETDAYDPRADRVALMTLHAAKGLEFPVVFIVGCEQGLVPYLPEGKLVDLAEERRLFYVGMTRARRKLILTRARTRMLFGQHRENPLSPFVADIEAGLMEIQEMNAGVRANKPDAVQLSLF